MTALLENHSGYSDIDFMRGWASHLAENLYTLGMETVQRVEIFGSIPRGNATINSDFDMIVCADGFTAARWFFEVRDAANGDMYDESMAHIRQTVALRLLGINPEELHDVTGIMPYKLDLFLFPSDWRNRLDELQGLGRHVDPLFMQKIAADALMFVPGQPIPHRWQY